MSGSPEEDTLVLTRPRPHVALVRLNRPDALNAIDSHQALRLEAAVLALEADPEVRVAVITGTGPRAFCAGADLKEMQADPTASRRTPGGGFAGFVDRPRAKPWIAAVEGAAVGGGLEICLACDLRVAGQGARFALPEVKRANLAVGGGLRRLPCAIPRTAAVEMILTGDPIDAQRAYALGLLNRLTPEGGALDAALAMAETIAANAPGAVAASLAILKLVGERPEAEVIEAELNAWRRIRSGDDYMEGTRAFIERRPPKWTGL